MLQVKSGWLRGLDSNQDNQLQRLACYQLHYPGTGNKIVADLLPICYSADEDQNRLSPRHFATLKNCRCAFQRRTRVCRPGFNLLGFWSSVGGEVSERFKEHAWKACVGETQPWVRIPPSPP